MCDAATEEVLSSGSKPIHDCLLDSSTFSCGGYIHSRGYSVLAIVASMAQPQRMTSSSWMRQPTVMQRSRNRHLHLYSAHRDH